MQFEPQTPTKSQRGSVATGSRSVPIKEKPLPQFTAVTFSERKKQTPPCPTRPSKKQQDTLMKCRATLGNQYEFSKRPIGNGSSSVVYKVRHLETNDVYALKIIHTHTEHVEREFDYANQLNSSYLIKYYQHLDDETKGGCHAFLLELANDNLRTFLECNKQIKEHKLKQWFRDLLEGLAEIHRNGFVHMDLRPENIFVKEMRLKIGDFGKLIKTTDYQPDSELEGDGRYAALELISNPDNHEISTKVDMFSFGLLMLEMATNLEIPQGGKSGDLWRRLRDGEMPDHINTLNEELQLLIRQQLSSDPNERLSAEDLLNHRYFARMQTRRHSQPSPNKMICRSPSPQKLRFKDLSKSLPQGQYIRRHFRTGSNNSVESSSSEDLFLMEADTYESARVLNFTEDDDMDVLYNAAQPVHPPLHPVTDFRQPKFI